MQGRDNERAKCRYLTLPVRFPPPVLALRIEPAHIGAGRSVGGRSPSTNDPSARPRWASVPPPRTEVAPVAQRRARTVDKVVENVETVENAVEPPSSPDGGVTPRGSPRPTSRPIGWGLLQEGRFPPRPQQEERLPPRPQQNSGWWS
jgi:hypothetical protein